MRAGGREGRGGFDLRGRRIVDVVLSLTDYKLSGPIFTLSTFQSSAPLSPLARGTAAGGHDRLVK